MRRAPIVIALTLCIACEEQTVGEDMGRDLGSDIAPNAIDISAAMDASTPADIAAPDLTQADLASSPDLAPPPLWERRTSNTWLTLKSIWGSGPGRAIAVGGWAEEGSVAVITMDGGKTWQASHGRALEYSSVWGTTATSPPTVFAVGFGADRSSDWGQTWTEIDPIGIRTSVWGSGPSNVIVTGFLGEIRRTTDGGASWSTHSSGTTRNLLGIWGSGPSDIYIVGDSGTILHSTDGTTWSPRQSGVTGSLVAVWGSGPRDVFACGDAGIIVHSTDGGTTWQQRQIGPQAGRLLGIWGVGSEIYAVGTNGTILHSSDGGTSWRSEDIGTFQGVWAVWGSSPTEVFAVGDGGMILRRR